MSTLGIFTVKSLHRHEGRYYTYGGFGKYLTSIRRHFGRTVLIAHVRHAPPRPGDYEIDATDLDVVGLPPITNELQALLTLPVQAWRCWRAVPRFDVAHARMPDYTGVLGALVCRLRGKPVFCQVVGDWAVEARRTPWRKKWGLGLGIKLHYWLYDHCERLVSRGLLVFAQGDTAFEKHRMTARARLVISAAHTEDDLRAPTRRFTRVPFTILTVARLDSVKNHELILAALARLQRKAPGRWRARFVGEGGRRSFLLAEAERLGVCDQVEFVGNVPHGSELWKHYDTADVFVLASRSEGTPKALLEAHARGLPAVASNVGGIPNLVVDRESGLLFSDNSVDGLCAALEQIATDEARERWAWAGHQIARANTVDGQTNACLEIVFREWPHLKA